MNLDINDLEKTSLDAEKYIFQFKDAFKFSNDTVELVNFVEINKKNKILEIGTGNGIIPILLKAKKDKILEYDAVEIQKKNILLAQENFKINAVSFINLIEEDIKNYKKSNYYDMIIANPPYMEVDGKKINENDSKAISRHEIELNLEDFIAASKRLLKAQGTLFFVHRAHRLVDLISMLTKYNFSVARLRFLTKSNKVTNIILIEALKGKKTQLKLEYKEIF